MAKVKESFKKKICSPFSFFLFKKSISGLLQRKQEANWSLSSVIQRLGLSQLCKRSALLRNQQHGVKNLVETIGTSFYSWYLFRNIDCSQNVAVTDLLSLVLEHSILFISDKQRICWTNCTIKYRKPHLNNVSALT